MDVAPSPPQLPVPPQLPPYTWRTLHPSAQLLYIRTLYEADRAIPLLNTAVLGFDLEWKPIFNRYQPENPVALVQLANDHYILLIQISQMREVPKSLKDLLENPSVLKAGVGIQKDTTKLFKDYRVSMRGCVDLALLARTVDNAQWKGHYDAPIGLARLVSTYESLAMAKGKVQRSNWERFLSPAQQEYAGNDAHAGFVLCMRLAEMINKMPITPRAEYYMFDCIDGILRDQSGAPWLPHNPDYDPGPPPPPRVNKHAVQTDPVAQPDGTVSLRETAGDKAVESEPVAQQTDITSSSLVLPAQSHDPPTIRGDDISERQPSHPALGGIPKQSIEAPGSNVPQTSQVPSKRGYRPRRSRPHWRRRMSADPQS